MTKTKPKPRKATAAAEGPDLVEVLIQHGRKVPGDELTPGLRGEVVKRHVAEAAAQAAAEDMADLTTAWDQRPSAAPPPPPPVQPNFVTGQAPADDPFHIPPEFVRPKPTAAEPPITERASDPGSEAPDDEPLLYGNPDFNSITREQEKILNDAWWADYHLYEQAKRSYFNCWWPLRQAMWYLRDHAMQLTGANSYHDDRYRKKLADLITSMELRCLTDKLRDRLLAITPEVDAWYRSLPEDKQAKWNYPGTILKHYYQEHGTPTADAAPSEPPTADELVADTNEHLRRYYELRDKPDPWDEPDDDDEPAPAKRKGKTKGKAVTYHHEPGDGPVRANAKRLKGKTPPADDDEPAADDCSEIFWDAEPKRGKGKANGKGKGKGAPGANAPKEIERIYAAAMKLSQNDFEILYMRILEARRRRRDRRI